jgi:hypothetical protein
VPHILDDIEPRTVHNLPLINVANEQHIIIGWLNEKSILQ